MKQTNDWSRSILSEFSKLERDCTGDHLKNDIIFGYRKKVESLVKSGSVSIDFDKITFYETALTYVYFAEKCFHDNERTECLLALKQICYLAVGVPNHKFACLIFEH